MLLLQLQVVLMTKFLGRKVRLRTKSYINDTSRAAAVLCIMIQATNCLPWSTVVSECSIRARYGCCSFEFCTCRRMRETARDVRMDKRKACSTGSCDQCDKPVQQPEINQLFYFICYNTMEEIFSLVDVNLAITCQPAHSVANANCCRLHRLNQPLKSSYQLLHPE